MVESVSILIPNYNKAPFLEETLNSVLDQTYLNWECIIVDDHSIDNSWQILEEFAALDSRFQIIKRPNELLKGGNICRNYALSIAKSEYCIFLDSDDVLADFCLEQRFKSINDFPENDFWVFKSLMFDQVPDDAINLWNIETNESDLVRFLRMDALWQTTGPIYRKSFLIKINGFDENLAFWQDYDLHLRAIISGGKYLKLYDLPPDVYIREGDKNSLSRSTPFTADKDILLKRIEFIERIIQFSELNGPGLNKEERFTVCSSLYFFAAQFWVKHGDFGSFISKWKTIFSLSSLSRFSFFLGIFDVGTIKLSNKFPFFWSIPSGFRKRNPLYFLDYNKMKETSLCKVPNVLKNQF